MTNLIDSYRFFRVPDKFFNIGSIFVISFLFLMLFVFQGFDVTDPGFNLIHQVYALKFPVNIDYVYPIVFFSDFIGGLWLSLISSPNLLWARLGGVLLYSLNAAIIFSILSDYFGRKRTFLVVMLFVSMIPPCPYINYDTFPAFLINVVLWVFNRALGSSTNTISHKFYGFLIGFLAFTLVLSRVTLVMFSVTPFIFLVYYVATKRNLQVFKRMAFLAGSGYVCAIGVFGLLYWHIGLLPGFISYLFWIASQTPSSTGSHGLLPLIMLFIYQCKFVAIVSALLIFGLYFISDIGSRTNNSIAEGLIIFLTLTILGITRIFHGRFLDELNYYNIIMVSIGPVLLLSGLYIYADKGQSRNLTLLILTGIIAVLEVSIGSDSGFMNSIYGMWLIMPLSILCVYEVKDRIEIPRVSSILSLLNGLLIAVLIVSLFFQATNIYRDDPNRLHLTTAFSQPSLKGIYSTSDRAKVIDELLVEIDKYVNKGDSVLIIDSLPLIYYLTETKPALGDPWIETQYTFSLYQEDIRKEQLMLEKDGRYPKLFITAKVDTRDASWPSSNSVLNEKDELLPHVSRPLSELNKYLKDRYINYLHYSLVWENKAFRMYKRG